MKVHNGGTKILKRIGFNIRQLRHQKGWSQEVLAEHCDLHRTYIGAIERGERHTNIRTLVRISEALKVELESLVKAQTY